MRIIVGLVCALLGTAALAQEGMYAGLGYGAFDYEEKFVDPVLGRVSETTSLVKLVGGFEFNDYFALEINYGKSGDIEERGTYFDLNVLQDVEYAIYTDFTITSFKAIGRVPFNWGSLLGGLGYYSSSNDFLQTFSTPGFPTFSQEIPFDDDGLTYMAGLEWRFGRFGKPYRIRAEYETWDISELDLSAVNLIFSFGF